MSPKPQLPNTPLVSVAYEIKFHGDLSLFSAWGELQRELLDSYPKLYVSGAAVGVSPLLQPMRLASSDDRQAVALCVNSFAYSSMRYTVFAEFRAEFQRTFEALRRVFRLERLTRLGLRYINLLPPVFEGPRPPDRLHPCLSLALTGWPGCPLPADEHSQFVTVRRAGATYLRLALLEPQQVGPFAALSIPALAGTQLDLDCYRTEGLDVDVVLPFLDEAHALIDTTFFAVITPEYRQFLSGAMP